MKLDIRKIMLGNARFLVSILVVWIGSIVAAKYIFGEFDSQVALTLAVANALYWKIEEEK